MYAEPFTPQDGDTVIARWPVDKQNNRTIDTVERAISTSNEMLKQATKPGESYRYGLAKAMLEPWFSTSASNADFWLAWARIQQQQHNFNDAIKSLDTVLQLEPNNKNAHLILSRIHVIQQNYDLAEQSCKNLLKSGDLFRASICKLEVNGHQQPLDQSYAALKSIYARLHDNDTNTSWIVSILADMAVRQGLVTEGESILDNHVNEMDISYLIQWADIKLSLKKYREVYQRLSSIILRTTNSEDSLLVRLAVAENGLLNTNQLTSEPRPWAQRIRQRVELREQRQDISHASDIALFYLDVEHDALKRMNGLR